LALISGCSEATTPTSVSETPPAVLSPSAPDETKAAPAKSAESAPSTDEAKTTTTKAAEPAPTTEGPKTEPKGDSFAPTAEPSKADAPKGGSESASASAGDVRLVPIKFDDMLSAIAANKGAKLTMVDAWATWCGPCKENFPHVVEMNQKYAGQGLAVVSLSLDDSTEAKDIQEAKKFLTEKKAVFSNYVLTEDQASAFNKLNVSTIPAVFLYGPDGKEVKRFTMDDPDNQFTYDQVEQTVAAMLKGEPAPEFKKAAR
jgi:thiol-disulfide isomerase/thioredoxin